MAEPGSPRWTWRALAAGAVALSAGELAHGRARALVGVLALAVGVALMVAIYTVNASALEAFEHGVREFAGTADLIVRGPRAGFDEALYPRLRALAGVDNVSPELEVTAALGDGGTLSLRGLDPFRLAALDPALAAALGPDALALLGADTVVLSAAAAARHCPVPCRSLGVRIGTAPRALTVIAVLPESAVAGEVALMDIGTAQWTFDRLGWLSVLRVRAAAGVARATLAATLAAEVPPGVVVETPDADAERGAVLSRAYRLNLNLLALVALLTGGFLVYATRALSVGRRLAVIGVLRALGVPRSALRGLLVGEGALLGLVAAGPGIVTGLALAALVLRLVGADLGGGYFRGAPTLSVHVLPLVGFAALAVLAAAAGAWLPARRALGVPVARALKGAGVDAGEPERRGVAAVALGAAVVALLGLALPSPAGLPLGGYLSIAALLVAAISLVPVLGTAILAVVPAPAGPVVALPKARLRADRARLELTLGALIISVALMVAMTVMVFSFRVSFLHWLDAVLPADLNARVPFTTTSAYWPPVTTQALAALPGVARAEFRVEDSVLLAPGRPVVALIARPLGPSGAGSLPLVRRVPASAAAAVDAGVDRVYVSEALVDLYGWQPGDTVVLPLGGARRTVTVAGVWRDYARSFGAITLDLETYHRLGGSALPNAAQFWLAAGADPVAVEREVRRLTGASGPIEVVSTPDIKARSVAIFDRAFVLTYGLLGVAVAVGLLGMGFVLSAEILARRSELGLLRHLGFSRAAVVGLLAVEGALQGVVAAVVGLGLGLLISVILVHVVNRESFHWSIDLSVPGVTLGLAAVVLVAATALTSALVAHAAARGTALSALREEG